MELPTKGKEVIAICEDGVERELFRCNCFNELCEKWRCAISGMEIMVVVLSWRYIDQISF